MISPNRYDYENVDSLSASTVINHLRQMCGDEEAMKKEFGSYQVKTIDDFCYQDPIDESVTEKQVLIILVCFLLFLKGVWVIGIAQISPSTQIINRGWVR